MFSWSKFFRFSCNFFIELDLACRTPMSRSVASIVLEKTFFFILNIEPCKTNAYWELSSSSEVNSESSSSSVSSEEESREEEEEEDSQDND